MSVVYTNKLNKAETVHNQVTPAFGARDRQPEVMAGAQADRARAFTLFYNAYDQLRRAATFIRWGEEDADKFVPSLYEGRGGRGKKAPTPVTPDAPAANAATTPAPVPALAAVKPAPVSPNMPGGSPFIS